MRSRSDSFDTALLSAVKTAFLDSAYPSEEGYRPQVVTNDRRRGRNVLSVVKRELSTCESFDLCVAFVAESGLQMLVQVLSELRDRGIKSRILTSTYLNFNSPAVFGKLLEYGNITTRVYQGSLHAKGYVFESDGAATVILGSSNLTQTALACNKEWNILFRSHENGEMIHAIRSEFDGLWDSVESVDLTAEWIDSYGATVANTGWFHLRLRGRLKPCPGPRCPACHRVPTFGPTPCRRARSKRFPCSIDAASRVHCSFRRRGPGKHTSLLSMCRLWGLPVSSFLHIANVSYRHP